jgi:hypothetical protein
VQLEAVLADVDGERLKIRAGEAGAKVIALREFFTTERGTRAVMTGMGSSVRQVAA